MTELSHKSRIWPDIPCEPVASPGFIVRIKEIISSLFTVIWSILFSVRKNSTGKTLVLTMRSHCCIVGNFEIFICIAPPEPHLPPANLPPPPPPGPHLQPATLTPTRKKKEEEKKRKQRNKKRLIAVYTPQTWTLNPQCTKSS